MKPLKTSETYIPEKTQNQKYNKLLKSFSHRTVPIVNYLNLI